ncbi:hypothetical protein DFH27DRAFT_610359 [Peziza echinospora]|nr:hypothetical protein DFH27DRAFT_610359 [Peziza echinospora]
MVSVVGVLVGVRVRVAVSLLAMGIILGVRVVVRIVVRMAMVVNVVVGVARACGSFKPNAAVGGGKAYIFGMAPECLQKSASSYRPRIARTRGLVRRRKEARMLEKETELENPGATILRIYS